MKKKKHLNKIKTKHYNETGKFCNHCGGALKFSQDDVSCLMCGRGANHFCDNCMTAQDLIKKSA